MALLKASNFDTIDGVEYKFVHITDFILRTPLELDEDPKVEILVKTLDYAMTSQGKRLKLPKSEKTYTLSKMITEIVGDIDLATSLYYQEQVFISFLNKLNGNSNLSYFQHIQ